MTNPSEFKLVSPRPDVEIHLPDGRMISGPRGAAVGDFLKILEFPAPLAAAIVNDDLRELTFPVEIESNVRPVLTSDADGARIYRRSLNFLLEMAFEDQFPKAKLTIDHSLSSGGYYCQVSGRKALAASELAALKAHMQALVDADRPFKRTELPLREAIEYFRRQGPFAGLPLQAVPHGVQPGGTP